MRAMYPKPFTKLQSIGISPLDGCGGNLGYWICHVPEIEMQGTFDCHAFAASLAFSNSVPPLDATLAAA
jgi:hypothetical protein